jgi:hypothetical protein
MSVRIMNRGLHGEKVERGQEQLLVFDFPLKLRRVPRFRSRHLIDRLVQIIYGDVPICRSETQYRSRVHNILLYMKAGYREFILDLEGKMLCYHYLRPVLL